MSDKTKRLMFTMARLAALEPAKPGKRDRYWDEKVRGLALRVTDKGAKAFYCTRWAGTRSEEIRLGAFPDINVDMARELAQAAIVSMARGENPGDRKRALRGELTLQEVFDWWLEHHARPHRSKSYVAEAEREFKNHLKDLASRKASHVRRTDVRELHAKLSKKVRHAKPEAKPDDGLLRKKFRPETGGVYVANRVLALVRAVYNKAIAHEQITGPNPAQGIEAFDEVSRERRLMPGESARFIEAVAVYPNVDARDFVLMALFTGARRSNVLAMRWEDVDLDSRTWRIGMTKNGLPQHVPLEAAEVEILGRRKEARKNENPWVFPGRGKSGHLVEPKKAFAAMLGKAGISDLRVHDLRRSLGSFMADTGAASSVIGHALNHLSPAATAIYSRLSINPVRKAKRAALAEMHAND